MNTAGDNWKEVEYFPDDRAQKALVRIFTFSNFKEALSFTNKVGELAEKVGHHPDINLGWGYVKIWLTTHDTHSITDKDYKLAEKIDKLLN